MDTQESPQETSNPLLDDPYQDIIFIDQYPTRDNPISDSVLNPDKSEEKVRIVTCIAMNFILFCFAGATVYFLFRKDNGKDDDDDDDDDDNNVNNKLYNYFLLGILLLLYILYLIMTFIKSPIVTKLWKQAIPSNKIRDFFEQKFKSPPLFWMTVQTSIISNSKIIHLDDDKFYYYSFKDVSGLIELPTSICRLEIIHEFSPGDTITHMDYLNQKSKLYMKNVGRGEMVRYVEKRTTRDQIDNVLLNTDSCLCCCCLSKLLFILSVVLCLSFLYHFLFYCCVSKKQIRIRKIFSTRYNVNEGIFQNQTAQMKPAIMRKGIIEGFNEEETCGIFPNHQRSPPTQQDIALAQGFESEIPKYKILRTIEEYGIVADIPELLKYDYNVAPIMGNTGNSLFPGDLNISNMSNDQLLIGDSISQNNNNYLPSEQIIMNANSENYFKPAPVPEQEEQIPYLVDKNDLSENI
jgi:hypothetical protein